MPRGGKGPALLLEAWWQAVMNHYTGVMLKAVFKVATPHSM